MCVFVCVCLLAEKKSWSYWDSDDCEKVWEGTASWLLEKQPRDQDVQLIQPIYSIQAILHTLYLRILVEGQVAL